MERHCIYCKELIHPMRIEVLPNTKVCVKCSKEDKKAARITAKGKGEDVEVQLEFMDKKDYQKLIGLNTQYTYDYEDVDSYYEEEE